ncbi:hypothetical protein BH23CHL2_BH23CHL2_01560 [soil metagenome]
MPRRTIIAIDPLFVWRILVIISVILITLDVSLQTLDWMTEPAVPGWDTVVIILDADGESSIPTWWGSLLLTTAAITSALAAYTGRHAHPRDHL